MAERSHSIHLIRRLPELGGQLLRYSFEIVFTTAGIIWIDPASAPIALLAALAAHRDSARLAASSVAMARPAHSVVTNARGRAHPFLFGRATRIGGHPLT